MLKIENDKGVIVGFRARQTHARSPVRRDVGGIDTDINRIALGLDQAGVLGGALIHVLHEAGGGIAAGEEVKHTKERRGAVVVFEDIAASSDVACEEGDADCRRERGEVHDDSGRDWLGDRARE